MAKGLTNREIGEVLAISPATIRTHVTAILRSLEVTNRTEAVGVYFRDTGAETVVDTVLARPAIAVLPMVALPDDPPVKLVAGGITCDLTSLLARYRTFPVITNSSVHGLPQPDPTSHDTLGQELRARFLVGGTLRARGGAWRLVAYADDAVTHERLWNERYDFAESELFDVQDEVVERIAASAYALFVAQLGARHTKSGHGDAVDAWTSAHAGMAAWASRDASGCEEASRLFEAALARDPSLVLAHFGVGLTAYARVLNQWGQDGDDRERLAACAERCDTLAPHAAEGLFLWARHAMVHKDLARARHSLEAAVERNPSFAMAHAVLAQVLQLSGEPEPAMVAMRNAVRLGPRSFVAGLATMHFAREEYADALNESCRALVAAPTYAYARLVAAAAAWWLDDLPQAQRLYAELKRARPDFRPSVFVATFGPGNPSVQRVQQALEALEGGRPRASISTLAPPK